MLWECQNCSVFVFTDVFLAFREAKKTRREGKKNGDEGGAATTPVKVIVTAISKSCMSPYRVSLVLPVQPFRFPYLFDLRLLCCCLKASKTLSTETPAAAAPTEDEDWSVDTSAAAVRERQRDLTSAAASLAVNDDLELPIGRRLEKFFAFVQVHYSYLSLRLSVIIFKTCHLCLIL